MARQPTRHSHPVTAQRPTKRPRKYPIWFVRTITIVALLTTVIVAVAVLLLGKRSLLVEAEWVAAIVAFCLFVFLFLGLYRGIRVRKNEPVPSEFEFNRIDPADFGDAGSLVDVAGASDDVASAILAPVLFVLLGLLLIILLPLLVNLVWLLLFVFVLMLVWIFRYALRQVFVRSRVTRGDWVASARYAAFYTVLYSGWLLRVLLIARATTGG